MSTSDFPSLLHANDGTEIVLAHVGRCFVGFIGPSTQSMAPRRRPRSKARNVPDIAAPSACLPVIT